MIESTISIFVSSINFFIHFFTYKIISNNWSAKYHPENKERLQKQRSDNMVMNDTKICQKMKKKSLLSIEKNSRRKNVFLQL